MMIYITTPLIAYTLFLSLTTAYDNTSCAYFSTHVVAEPLESCSVYSYEHTQYSWNYFCENNEVKCRYFDSATTCDNAESAPTIRLDEVGSTTQCTGSGSNCHTVDIKVKGFSNVAEGASICDDETDYFLFSFVVDECIPSVLEGTNFSAILSCDSEKLFFEYYTGCLDCTCEMETYTYEYYDDFDGCWDVICGLHEASGVGTAQMHTTQPPKGKCNSNSAHHANKLKEILFKPLSLTKAAYYTSKKKKYMANVISENKIKGSTQYLYDKIAMNWISIVAVLGIIIILLGGAWNFIKEKEYSMI